VRLRGVLFDTQCTLCKEELAEVVVAASVPEGLRLASARAEAFDHGADAGDFCGVCDSNLGIIYTARGIKEQVEQLFSYTCWLQGCNEVNRCFATLEELSTHLLEEHGRMFCNTCLYNRKCFLHEQLLYDPVDMDRHYSEGDNLSVLGHSHPPIPVHAGCDFCHTYFYSADELLEHMNREHQLCAICERQHHSNKYYRDVASLSLHYEEQHYVCYHENCLHDSHRLVVFATEDELWLHETTAHSMHVQTSTRAKKQGTRICLQMGAASYREEHERRRQNQQAQQAHRVTVSTTSPEVPAIVFAWPRGRLAKSKSGRSNTKWHAAGELDSEFKNRYPPRALPSSSSRAWPRQAKSQTWKDDFKQVDDTPSVPSGAMPEAESRTVEAQVPESKQIVDASSSQGYLAEPQVASQGVRSAWRRGAQRAKAAEATTYNDTSGLLLRALRHLDSSLNTQEGLELSDYRDRNRQFKSDLQEALGPQQLSEFKECSAAFRRSTAQAATASERKLSVSKYVQQVLQVFSAALAPGSEAKIATLLADLVALLPDKDLRHDLYDELRNVCDRSS